MAQEFLPLCDVLFNIISMASYFCDVVFDVITAYTLYQQQQWVWLSLAVVFIVSSLVISQILSAKWFLQRHTTTSAPGASDANADGTSESLKEVNKGALMAIHLVGMGVLWRYFKLFIPVDLRIVKHEVRDLCMLRLTHAFVEAAPMLLVQLYLIWLKPSRDQVSDLNMVSTVLSLFSVCWALASFNKNVRRQHVHKLVLTWLGVIFQFMWRLGTVTSRVVALSVYATVYSYWVFLVIGLHWMSMFFWLISPRNVFHGDKMSKVKKDLYCALIAVVYIFCYVNLQHVNPRMKMAAFYVTMFLENTLLVAVWLIGVHAEEPWYYELATVVMFLSFFVGILFLALYYQYFHVKRLSYATNNNPPAGMPYSYVTPNGTYIVSNHVGDHHAYDVMASGKNAYSNSATNPNTGTFVKQNGHAPFTYGESQPYVPGVFNCRFNPAMMRKKKKPTTFVPPPVAVLPANGMTASGNGGKMSQPFWKRPLPRSGSSENENDSICSRVDIQQKLQEKKRQQLAELRVIEEEIKQGKLKRPPQSDVSETGTLKQPIPRSKKQPWPSGPIVPEPPIFAYGSQGGSGHRKYRSKTPEILLSPHHLENSRIYYDYYDPRWRNGPSYHPQGTVEPSSGGTGAWDRTYTVTSSGSKGVIYKSYRISSDMESQVSLPRSYTLPREFKYKRPKSRKAIRSEHFIHSTNSSDGDVDSGDDNDVDDAPTSGMPPSLPPHPHALPYTAYGNRNRFNSPFRGWGLPNQHETKL